MMTHEHSDKLMAYLIKMPCGADEATRIYCCVQPIIEEMEKRFERRQQDLLERNNELLERARVAENDYQELVRVLGRLSKELQKK